MPQDTRKEWTRGSSFTSETRHRGGGLLAVADQHESPACQVPPGSPAGTQSVTLSSRIIIGRFNFEHAVHALPSKYCFRSLPPKSSHSIRYNHRGNSRKLSAAHFLFVRGASPTSRSCSRDLEDLDAQFLISRSHTSPLRQLEPTPLPRETAARGSLIGLGQRA